MDKPDLKVVPNDEQDAPAPAGEPTTDPNRADIGALSVTGLVRSIGALVRTVAEDQRIPIGAANSIVKTALEFHINAKALAMQEQRSLPFIPPAAPDETEDTDGSEA